MKIPDGITFKPPLIAVAFTVALAVMAAHSGSAQRLAASKAACWTRAPWNHSNFFPIAVWLQNPTNADRYRLAGINTYAGLWQGPTEGQLATLKAAGLRAVCSIDRAGMWHTNDPTIIAWLQRDEPDNAQTPGARFGFGSPVPPSRILNDYQYLKTLDPTRPVLLNLGQGVAWDNWYGRGRRKNHPEDYPEYLKGCDIASFDIYPVNHEKPEMADKLWYVGRGVERLVQWGNGEKRVWNCIECTALESPRRKPTPEQVRAEVWMSLVHGSSGLIYFVHQFKPRFDEAALLDDPEMLAAVTRLNGQITALAPVLNSPTLRDAVSVQTQPADGPVSWMAKRVDATTYLFVVGMTNQPAEATFTFAGGQAASRIEVLGEDREIDLHGQKFSDHFGPWGVHLYKLTE